MRSLFALALAASMLVTQIGPAFADPITCPAGQESVKTDDGWTCRNNGGNDSNAAETKNPNDKR